MVVSFTGKTFPQLNYKCAYLEVVWWHSTISLRVFSLTFPSFLLESVLFFSPSFHLKIALKQLSYQVILKRVFFSLPNGTNNFLKVKIKPLVVTWQVKSLPLSRLSFRKTPGPVFSWVVHWNCMSQSASVTGWQCWGPLHSNEGLFAE